MINTAADDNNDDSEAVTHLSGSWMTAGPEVPLVAWGWITIGVFSSAAGNKRRVWKLVFFIDGDNFYTFHFSCKSSKTAVSFKGKRLNDFKTQRHLFIMLQYLTGNVIYCSSYLDLLLYVPVCMYKHTIAFDNNLVM